MLRVAAHRVGKRALLPALESPLARCQARWHLDAPTNFRKRRSAAVATCH